MRLRHLRRPMSEPSGSAAAGEPSGAPEGTETLDLPSGETVAAGEMFSFNGYPYRFVPLDHEEYEFKLAPLYWGGGDMDVPFEGRDELVEQWGPESRGVLADEAWRDWLTDARTDDRYGDGELDAVERELFACDADGGSDAGDDGGLMDRLRRLLGGR